MGQRQLSAVAALAQIPVLMGEASAQKVAAVAAERDEAKQQLRRLCADHRSGLIDPPPAAATPEGLGGLQISAGWCGSRGGAACGLSG